MQIAMQRGYPYFVAALVGICFGALMAGAVLFVTYTPTASAVEWSKPAPVTAPR